MINKKFIEETDKLIERFKERKIGVWNGNIIVAKVKADKVTKGGLVLPDDATFVEDYHNGLARIVAVADNVDSQYKPGLYIIHSHEARYKVLEEAMREALDYVVDKDFLYCVQDNNVLMSMSQELMHV